jgi:hypothetical protein
VIGKSPRSVAVSGPNACGASRQEMQMGIVVFCPSGHRVKVKDELAGRKGVCPECQARFRIPRESCPIPTARVLGFDAAWAASLRRAVILSADHAFLTSQSGGLEHRPATSPTHTFQEAAPRLASPPAPRLEPDAPPALHRLLAAEPAATWCIAIRGGEPSAQLTAAEMQAWLGSGRPTGEELVWRSDWADWVAIRLVFPEHVPVA